jgi:hypothetical protein
MTLIDCERLYDGAGREWIWEWIQKFASAKRKAMDCVCVWKEELVITDIHYTIHRAARMRCRYS